MCSAMPCLLQIGSQRFKCDCIGIRRSDALKSRLTASPFWMMLSQVWGAYRSARSVSAVLPAQACTAGRIGIAHDRGLSSPPASVQRYKYRTGGLAMEGEQGISRRHALAVSAAAGCVALSGGVRGASAQAQTRIEQLAPELD